MVASTMLAGALIVAALYFAQDILIPIALAGLLTFVLSPIVTWLCRIGVHRVAAVVMVVAGFSLVLAGLTVLLVVQSGHLIQELPRHRHTIRQRIQDVKASVSAETSQFQDFVREMWREVEAGSADANVEVLVEEDAVTTAADPETAGPWGKLSSLLPTVFTSTASGVGTLALAVALAAFMLIKREDLRDRFVRLIGADRVAATTKAMDDAGRRISRYLFTQFLVNSTYGIIFGIAMALIGIPYAGLWGVLAGILRYIPFLGAWLASAAPILLSLATSQGWWQPVMALCIVLVLELILNNVAEPMLYGSSMGVSQVAFIVFAAVWAFLWGMVGLVLSAPLTVILLVLGQRVPQLSALNVLLGEETPLEAHVRFFQRLIAGDREEAAEILAERVAETDAVRATDEILLPALNLLVENWRAGAISDDELGRAHQRAVSVMDDLAILQTPVIKDVVEGTSPPRLVLIPADPENGAALTHIIQSFLAPAEWKVEVPAPEMLLAELADWINRDPPFAVATVGLAASDRSFVRYLCKRLAAPPESTAANASFAERDFGDSESTVSENRFLLGWLGNPRSTDECKESFQSLGVRNVAATLADTLQVLASWRLIAGAEPVSENSGHPSALGLNEMAGISG